MPLRSLAPLVAGKLTPGSAATETVAASNVVDGVELLGLAGHAPPAPPSAATLVGRLKPAPALSTADWTSLQAVLDDAADRLDAVGDLALAEAVFQTVQGNPVRAGAAEASVSGAPVPPVDPEILRRPRAGVAVTHRVAIALPTTPTLSAVWDATPRAKAEPRLEALVNSILPSSSAIRVVARQVNGDGTVASRIVSLDALLTAARTAARPELGIAGLDLVLGTDPESAGGRSGIDARLAALLALQWPPPVGAQLAAVLERDRAWPPEVWSMAEVLEIARAVRVLVTSARPLRPADLTPLGETPSHSMDDNELLDRAVDAPQRAGNVPGEARGGHESRRPSSRPAGYGPARRSRGAQL